MTESGGRTFVVPDIHGRLDLLEAALESIASYAPSTEGADKTIFLGDYIDRGPQSAQILQLLMAGPRVGTEWICLKGNHEAMMALALRNPDRLDWWIDNGGEATIASYRDDRAAVSAHLAWIDARPLIHVDAHRVYVHAGVDNAIPLEAQAERTLIWKRYAFDANEGHGNRHVVHGHDPNPHGPLQLSRRTALDTYAWYTGRLVVGVFDDQRAGGPIDLIEITEKIASRRAGFRRS